MSRPFVQMRLTTNQDLLDKLRQLPERAQRNIRRKIATELVPYLEARAKELMSDMTMPSSPFVFGTPRSRLYYFWLIHNNKSLADDSHWIRTMRIESGFRFNASDRFRQIQIKGRNVEDKAQYVFGPWLVPGHRNTGWPEKLEEVRQQLEAESRAKLKEMWHDSVREGLKGQG